jgi:uncharacterized protein YndB with AHSA1/START domain
MYGSFETIENRPSLRFERRLSHPIDVVWRAITATDELEHWFPSNVQADLRVGGRMTFTFESMPLPDGPTTMKGEVTEFDPPRLFAFSWGEDHLRFELEPVDGQEACLLRLTVLLDGRYRAARDAAGWHVCLDRLEGLLAGDGGRAKTGANSDWRAVYEEYQRRGLPAGAPIPAE